MSFIEIYFNSSLQDAVEIKTSTVSIGRASYNQVQIDNKGISLLHAVITQNDKEWLIEDLNSTNGTYLNGVKVEGKQKIKFGDTITICKHDLRFVSTRSHVAQSDTGQSSLPSDDSDRTLMIGSSQSAENSSKATNCSLLVHGEQRNINKLLLNKDYYAIGKGKQCDLRVGGWFTPKLIAEITRLGNNYYLSPRVKKLVKVNGHSISAQMKLSNDDSVTIKKMLLKFVAE